MAQIRTVSTASGGLYIAVLFGNHVAVGYNSFSQSNSTTDTDTVSHSHMESSTKSFVKKTFGTTLRSLQFSDNDHYLIVCGDDKKAILLDPRKLTSINEKDLSKRPTSFMFVEDNSMLLVADKAGEVNRYKLPELSLDHSVSLMLGHSSIVLDMTLLSCGGVVSGKTFIATCDRDEKIRVSCYPNSYNIQKYCLHHTSFISCLCAIKRFPQILLSGGGDGLVCVWDWYNGKLLSSVDLHHEDNQDNNGDTSVVTGIQEFSKYNHSGGDNRSDNACLIAVTTSRYSGILFYTLTSSGILSLAGISLALPCIPWSMDTSIDSTGNNDRLWVCVNDKTAPVQCYQVIPDKIIPVMADDEPLLKEFNELPIVEGAAGCEVNWSDLQKHDYDNMTSYLARKEERINLKSRGRCGLIDEDEEREEEDECPRQSKTMRLLEDAT